MPIELKSYSKGNSGCVVLRGELDAGAAPEVRIVVEQVLATKPSKLVLYVDEIATNIVLHGYQAAGLKGDLRVYTETEPGRLVVRIEDTGRTYDPHKHDVPDADDLQSPLHERSAGGLGIMLAMQGVDELRYSNTERGH